MKKILVLFALFAIFAGSSLATAEECDPNFKGIEFYYCKAGKITYKMELEDITETTCSQFTKLTPTAGCEFSFEVASANEKGLDGAFIMVGAADKKFYLDNNTAWQCKDDDGYGGGFDNRVVGGGWFSTSMNPDYSHEKYPALSEGDRGRKYETDLEKQKKSLLNYYVNIYAPNFDQTKNPIRNEVCQFYNQTSNTTAVKLNYAFTGRGGGSSPSSFSPGGEKSDAKKGLKKLFGR